MVNAPNVPDYRDALVAMAGLSGVLWTGVLIIRQLGLRYDNRLRIAGEFFAFGFLAPMLGLLVSGKWLQIWGWVFFALYIGYPIKNIWDLRGTKASLKHATDQDIIIYTAGQLLYIAAIAIIAVYHNAITIGACAFILNFLGFRIVLEKLLSRVEPNVRVGFAPIDAAGILGSVLSIGLTRGYNSGRYILRLMATNKGAVSADNYRLTLYLPKGFTLEDGTRYGYKPLVPGQWVDLDGALYQEAYIDGEHVPVTRLHPIEIRPVSFLPSPAEGSIFWRFTSQGGYEAEGKQFVRLESGI